MRARRSPLGERTHASLTFGSCSRGIVPEGFAGAPGNIDQRSICPRCSALPRATASHMLGARGWITVSYPGVTGANSMLATRGDGRVAGNSLVIEDSTGAGGVVDPGECPVFAFDAIAVSPPVFESV